VDSVQVRVWACLFARRSHCLTCTKQKKLCALGRCRCSRVCLAQSRAARPSFPRWSAWRSQTRVPLCSSPTLATPTTPHTSSRARVPNLFPTTPSTPKRSTHRSRPRSSMWVLTTAFSPSSLPTMSMATPCGDSAPTRRSPTATARVATTSPICEADVLASPPLTRHIPRRRTHRRRRHIPRRRTRQLRHHTPRRTRPPPRPRPPRLRLPRRQLPRQLPPLPLLPLSPPHLRQRPHLPLRQHPRRLPHPPLPQLPHLPLRQLPPQHLRQHPLPQPPLPLRQRLRQRLRPRPLLPLHPRLPQHLRPRLRPRLPPRMHLRMRPAPR
jgi:hypothetical protein